MSVPTSEQKLPTRQRTKFGFFSMCLRRRIKKKEDHHHAPEQSASLHNKCQWNTATRLPFAISKESRDPNRFYLFLLPKTSAKNLKLHLACCRQAWIHTCIVHFTKSNFFSKIDGYRRKGILKCSIHSSMYWKQRTFTMECLVWCVAKNAKQNQLLKKPMHTEL